MFEKDDWVSLQKDRRLSAKLYRDIFIFIDNGLDLGLKTMVPQNKQNCK